MPREVLPYSEVLAKAQALLDCEECKSIRIRSLAVGAAPDGLGNWLPNISRSGDDNDIVACQVKIEAGLIELHRHHDVDEDSAALTLLTG